MADDAAKTDQQSGKVTLTQEQFSELMNRLNKLENQPNKTESLKADSGFDAMGKPVGFIQRYSIDPSYYDSPLERLYDLPELKRYSMRDNYELTWQVDAVQYDTKYNTSIIDPKFTIVLKRKLYDNDGALTNRRIIVQTGIFFEDPSASIKEAVEMGLPVDNANSREFLEQMRFLRYKQWLVERFNAKSPTSTKPKITEQVIDGKVYQIEDRSIEV